MASNPNPSSSKGKGKSVRGSGSGSREFHTPPQTNPIPTSPIPTTYPNPTMGGFEQYSQMNPAFQQTQFPQIPPEFFQQNQIPTTFPQQHQFFPQQHQFFPQSGFSQEGSTPSTMGATGSASGPYPSSSPSCEQFPETTNPFDQWYTEEEMPSLKNRKSRVWSHFVLSKDQKRARCRKCKTVFSGSTKGGTGHLQRHIEKCVNPSNDPTQPKMSFFHPHGFTYNYERDRDELGRMLVHSEQPFLFAENDAFNDYINRALQPEHKRISRKTAKSAAMKNYMERKLRLIDELDKLNCRVSLTSDAWDSGYGHHFLCVTCHWIDEQWLLQKRIIHFKMIEYPHTGLNIAHHIMQAIDEYNLRDKIMSMTFDNATSMTYCANLIKQQLTDVILDGEALHTRCICHVLNLCVRDGTNAIGPFYNKIRTALLSLNSSNLRLQEWKSFLRQQNIKPIKIKLDVQTRWNSAYDMLSTALRYRVPLTTFNNQKFPELALFDSDWDNCDKYMTFLQLLYNMTYCFSSVYVPCSHVFLANACLIAELFHEHRLQHAYDSYLPAMEEKWRKYYTDIPLVYVFASILDPRRKYDGTYALIDIYFNCMQYEDDVHVYKQTVTAQFFQLYRVYEAKYGTIIRSSGPSQPSKSVSKRAKGLFTQTANLLTKHAGTEASSRRTQSDVSELQMYLNYDFTKGMTEEEVSDLDVLEWWKSQTTKHPILAAMARDILAIQVSSVASERAFSASGRVLDDRRASLKPETLEMCVCFKDWLDAEKRAQDRSYEENDYDDTGSESSSSTSCSTHSQSQSRQLARDLEPLDEDEDEE